MSKARGGSRDGAGTRDNVKWIELDDDARQMLNILVKEARMLRGAKLSHRQVVKELIAERYGERDAAWTADRDDDGDVIAPPDMKGNVIMAGLMRDEDGTIKVAEINGRRYVACNHDLRDRRGEVVAGYCGELIDVTPYGDQIPDDLDCGNERNHVVA